MSAPAQEYIPRNQGGRQPSVNLDEVTAKVREYIATGYEAAGHLIPSLAGLCDTMDITKSMLYVWESERPDLAEALAKLKQRQELVLINNGLSGKFNNAICKLMLTTNHGYSDKTITESHATLELIDSTGSDAARRVLFAMQYAQQAISAQLPAISTDSKVNQPLDEA